VLEVFTEIIKGDGSAFNYEDDVDDEDDTTNT
jgi:hypothetical protein